MFPFIVNTSYLSWNKSIINMTTFISYYALRTCYVIWVSHSEGLGVRRVTLLRVFCREWLLIQQDEAMPGNFHGRLAEEDVRPAGPRDWRATRLLPHRPHPALRPLRLRFPEGQVHGGPRVPIQVYMSMHQNGQSYHCTMCAQSSAHCNVK